MKIHKEQVRLFKMYEVYLKKGNDKAFFEFLWYLNKIQKIGYPNFENIKEIDNIESTYREFITKTRKIIKNIHPPEMNLSIKVNTDEVQTTPYRKSGDNNITQVNYTNLHLKTIGE